MPVYEYRCRGCRQDFEALTRIAGRDKAECPHCGSRDVERKFSVFAAQSVESHPRATRPPGGGCGRCDQPGGCMAGGF